MTLGSRVQVFPLDLSLRDADPQELLDEAEAEAEASMTLDGFSLVPREVN